MGTQAVNEPRNDDETARRSAMLVHRFAVISGIGWLIDFSLFNALVTMGVAPDKANFVSASLAVLFVFLTSRRRLFQNARRPLPQAIALYAGYNLIAVIAASALVGGLSGPASLALEYLCPALRAKASLLGPALAKIGVTPVTMYANFVASTFINLKQVRFL